MRFQAALVTRILDTGDVKPLAEHGLDPREFTDDIARALLQTALEHQRRFTSIPSRQVAGDLVPEFEFQESQETTATLCEYVTHEITASKYSQLLLDGQDLIKRLGPLEAAREMKRRFGDIAHRNDKEVYRVGQSPDEEYRGIVNPLGGRIVVPSPYPPMQDATCGYRAGKFYVYYGQIKQAKSWLMYEHCVHAARNGRKVLLIDTEMDTEDALRRIYALDCKFPYSPLYKGEFFVGAEGNSRKLKLARSQCFFKDTQAVTVASTLEMEEELTIDLLDSLIERAEPDLVCIDQVHYITLPEKIQERDLRLLKLGKRLRSQAARYGIPYVATTQANLVAVNKRGRKGVRGEAGNASDLGGGNAFAAVCDFLGKVSIDPELGVRWFDPIAAREMTISTWATFAGFCDNLDYIPEDHPIMRNLKREHREVQDGPPRERPPRQVARPKGGGGDTGHGDPLGAGEGNRPWRA